MNKKILLKNRPVGVPDESHFEFIHTEIPEIKSGEILIETHYLSVDPYMRGRMSNAISYAKPYAVGEPFIGGVVGKVIKSKNPNYEPEQYVEGRLEWALFNISDGSNLRVVDPEAGPVSTALHVQGMPGLTAYFGLMDIGQPKKGETVVVSGASGAVGTIVGQIAKLEGCRVVGIAGRDDKCTFITEELGFDAAINYRTTDHLQHALKEACPNGVDVYFDNVGGKISDEVMHLLNFQSRIIICGQISQYNLDTPTLGPRVAQQLLRTSSLMKGFIVSDYKEQFETGHTQLTKWVREGKLKYRENIVEGFDHTIDAFLGLFRGDNIGKQLVKVVDEE